MIRFSGIGGVATVLLAISFLLSTYQPSHAASIKNPLKAHLSSEQKLELIYQLSKEAGLSQENIHEDVCLDPGCLDAALDILAAMNASVDPCQDFYQFACGRWIADNPAPPSNPSWGIFYRLLVNVNRITQEILEEPEDPSDPLPINQAKQFFATCMNLEEIEMQGIKPLQKIIADFGGWQILDPENWNPSGFDWVKASADLMRTTIQSGVLGVTILPHIKNTDQMIIYLDQPNLGLPRGVLLAPETFPTIIAAYENYIFEVAKELGSTQNDQELRQAAKDIIKFETELAFISSSEESRYDRNRTYNPYTLKAYQEETDKFDDRGEFTIPWKAFLDEIFSLSDAVVGEDQPVIVKERDYIKNLVPLLIRTEEQSKATLNNYIVWRLLQMLVGETNKAMRDINFRFVQALTGAKEQKSRDFTCTTMTNNAYGFATSMRYIERNFGKNSKQEVTDMSDILLASFKELVHEAEWMLNETKEKAMEKADAIRKFSSYPDWQDNKTAVEEFYKWIVSKEGYFDNQMELARYTIKTFTESIMKPTDKDLWLMSPVTVNAYMYWEYNSITILAGILQSPVFRGNGPKHQNYGAIGAIIGHEISHGFDQQGSQYDKYGNVENWWDEVTKAEYDKRSQCMIDQYSGYYVEEADMYLNGELTVGENIGDNGGLRQGFRAYQKYVEQNGPELKLPGLEQFSTDHLYFIGFANVWCESVTPEELVKQILSDPHSPGRFRTIGPVTNSDDFARVYNCPVESGSMNPPKEEKCTVW